MLRRTVLKMIASSVALCAAPLAAMFKQKVPPLRVDIRRYTYCSGALLHLTGTTDQLMEFYTTYQNVLWPITTNVADNQFRANVLHNQRESALVTARSGYLLCTLHGYIVGSIDSDAWTKASEAAVRATDCVLTAEAAMMMQRCGIDTSEMRLV